MISGTNNARLAAMLRQLAVYHAKDPNNLFCVRIAQGLTHLGKGTLTLCPYHNDRQLMSNVAVAGLMSFLVSCLDVKNSEYNGPFTLSQSNFFSRWQIFLTCHSFLQIATAAILSSIFLEKLLEKQSL